MPTLHRLLAMALALVPCSLLAAPLLGTPSYSTGLTTNAFLADGPCSESLGSASPLDRSCSSGNTISGAFGSAAAGPGFLRAVSTIDASSSQAEGSHGGSANANASLSEQLAIFGTANATGRLRASVIVEGQAGASVTGSALSNTAAGASFQLTGSFFGQNFSQQGGVTRGTNGYEQISTPFGVVIPIDVQLSFDPTGFAVGSFTLNLQTHADGLASGYQETSVSPYVGGHAAATSAFGNTVYWGGIASLTIDGQEIQDYTAFSASGLDYRVAAVPEPGPLAMLLAGLPVLAFGIRRRRQS